MNEKRTTPPIGAPELPHTPPEAEPRKSYPADGKDRLLLPLAWAVGVLGVNVLWGRGIPALGVTVLTAAWYGVLLWYRGRGEPKRWIDRFLLAAVFLLALTFSLYSNLWLRTWNLVFLTVLATVQMFQWPGQGGLPWTSPVMLVERLCLLLGGLFGALPASVDTVKSYKGDRRVLTVLAGFLLAIPLVLVALLLLTDADQYFALVTENVTRFLVRFFGRGVVRAILGLLTVPFLFGLLYTLRHPVKREEKSIPVLKADPLLPGVVLAVMDLLYGFFIAVQSAALFGGPAYLEQVSGLSYAEYARSGFFQLVFVALLNLTLVLAAVQLARQEGGAWRALRILATLLIAMSGVILVSAAYRMSLYVSVYGLSFKRFLTYWGMVMLGIFFAAALVKVWKKDFCYFKVLLTAAIGGWLVLNFCNVDRLVSKYNVSLYQRSEMAVIDLNYLTYALSYDALDAVEQLPGTEGELESRRQEAAQEASDWRTWSLSAALAARR